MLNVDLVVVVTSSRVVQLIDSFKMIFGIHVEITFHSDCGIVGDEARRWASETSPHIFGKQSRATAIDMTQKPHGLDCAAARELSAA